MAVLKKIRYPGSDNAAPVQFSESVVDSNSTNVLNISALHTSLTDEENPQYTFSVVVDEKTITKENNAGLGVIVKLTYHPEVTIPGAEKGAYIALEDVDGNSLPNSEIMVEDIGGGGGGGGSETDNEIIARALIELHERVEDTYTKEELDGDGETIAEALVDLNQRIENGGGGDTPAKGTVTAVKVNETVKSPDDSGVVDIGNFATGEEIDELQNDINDLYNNKQNILAAGSNINIDQNNVISATDTTYTNGTGLNLAGTTFSINDAVVATKTDLEDYATNSDVIDDELVVVQAINDIDRIKQNITMANRVYAVPVVATSLYDSLGEGDTPVVGDTVFVTSLQTPYNHNLTEPIYLTKDSVVTVTSTGNICVLASTKPQMEVGDAITFAIVNMTSGAEYTLESDGYYTFISANEISAISVNGSIDVEQLFDLHEKRFKLLEEKVNTILANI